MTYTAMYTYPWIMADEGVDTVLEAIHSRAGCDAVCLPFQYHSGKFLHPHGVQRKVEFFGQAAHHFLPEAARYEGTRVKPIVSEMAKTKDVLRQVREKTRELGKQLVAWFVMLHGTTLGSAYPELTQQTIYGDRMLFSLSPCHPDVREFLREMLIDVVANYEPDAVDLESIEFLPFTHDHHHELAGVSFDPFHEALMGLDFSEHTRSAIADRGVDVERVAFYVRRRLDRFFDSSLEETNDDWDYFAHAFLEEPELWKFFQARIAVITDLTAELVEAVHSVAQIPVNTILSWWRPLRQSWLEGHSAAQLAAVADGIDLIGYFEDPSEIRREVVHLQRLVDDMEKVTGCITATPPFVRSSEALRAAVMTMEEFGIHRFNFYNYGFMRLEVLDWIRAATRSDEVEIAGNAAS